MFTVSWCWDQELSRTSSEQLLPTADMFTVSWCLSFEKYLVEVSHGVIFANASVEMSILC